MQQGLTQSVPIPSAPVLHASGSQVRSRPHGFVHASDSVASVSGRQLGWHALGAGPLFQVPGRIYTDGFIAKQQRTEPKTIGHETDYQQLIRGLPRRLIRLGVSPQRPVPSVHQ